MIKFKTFLNKVMETEIPKVKVVQAEATVEVMIANKKINNKMKNLNLK